MKNFMDMIKTARDLQSKMEEVSARLDELEIQGEAGGGLVRVTLNGKGECKKVHIEPTFFAQGEEDRPVVEDLLIAAFNDAQGKLEQTRAEELSKAAGGLPIPGMPGVPQ